ncbi:uncharacterized protein B0P05DRAFT_447289, partial [Gilbertella persicaria]|uniref:uncharacterized protein n=1 Tax=Gilbertella persicaria TaxID=101096 RepID=UPI00222087D9
VNGFNISNALSQFGWSSLSLHDKGDALSDMRLLSLDHIYAFANDISSSVTKYLGQDVHFDVVQDLSLQLFEIFPEISPIISGLCIQLSTLHSAVPWIKMMELASSAILKTKGQDMETILYGSIIYKTITTLAGMNTALDNEDTFIHNCLHNLLASIFSCDKCFIQEWANKSLESSSTYQPDWCASVKFWKNKYNIIATEAKSKANQNRGIISDYVKLGRELKLMLEKLIYSGVNEPEVYGLLLKGGVLEIYMMDIKVDGIYRFVEIDTVNLVTNFTEMTNLMRTLPILYRLKERVLSIAKRLELVELQKSKGITVNP